jgi:hypothetical protein
LAALGALVEVELGVGVLGQAGGDVFFDTRSDGQAAVNGLAEDVTICAGFCVTVTFGGDGEFNGFSVGAFGLGFAATKSYSKFIPFPGAGPGQRSGRPECQCE